MKIALVHDFLNQPGGAEVVIEVLHELYPEAPAYTLIYEPDRMGPAYRGMDIRESPMLKRRFFRKHYKKWFPLYCVAIEDFDLAEYDLVISNSYAYAKGVVTRPETCHICYCQTPMRFAWVMPHDYMESRNVHPLLRRFMPYVISAVRTWDNASSDRVDYFVASCRNVARRIKKYYRRDSEIINLPVDTSLFAPSQDREDYYLMVSRLVMPYKRIDVVIEAFNKIDRPLKIVGDGSDYQYLKNLAANGNVEFMGALYGKDLAEVYSKARAFLFPSNDDFGITPLEAHASGVPVIAYRAGGALETVVEGKTGIFFDHQSPECVTEAVGRFEDAEFDSRVIREHALNFDRETFKKRLKDYVEQKYAEYQEDITAI